MTICVAVIAQELIGPTIVAATDKMVSTSQITFEMSSGKRFELAPKIYALGSGDSSDGLVVSRRTRARMQAEDVAGVERASEIFAEEYRALRRVTFEREVLSPIGLTLTDYLEKATGLPEGIVDRVDRTMQGDYLPVSDRDFGGSTIIAGVDDESGGTPDWITAHIYMITDPGQVTCADEIGFAAVGSGAPQAEAYLMLDRYSPDRDFNGAALAVYSAKRQAENAPFVGTATDLLRIDASGIGVATPQNFLGFERIYRKRAKSRDRASERANAEMTEYLEALNVPTERPKQERPPARKLDDEGAILEGSKEGEAKDQG